MPDQKKMSRNELYKRVWETPSSKLAREVGLSDVGLAKICKRHDIPKPPLGFWTRKRLGKHVKKAPLPACDDPKLQQIVIRPTPSGYNASPEILERIEHELLPESKIEVRTRLSSPHQLVTATKVTLRDNRSSRDGLLRTGLRAGTLDVSVSKGNLPRALRILDALVKALERRGMAAATNVADAYSRRQGCVVDVDGEKIPFRLREQIKQHKPVLTVEQERDPWRYSPMALLPNGRLALEIDGGWNTTIRRSWRDGTRQKVEDCLNSFIISIIQLAVHKKQERAKREEEHRLWQEERRRREEQRRREEAERARVEQLVNEAKAWREAQVVRDYIEAVRRQITAKEADENERTSRWLEWASARAREIDPLSRRVVDDKEPSGSVGLYYRAKDPQT